MNLLEKYIEKSISENLFLDIYRTSFSSGPIFGIIIKQSDQFICIKVIDEDGEYNGFALLPKAHISHLAYGGKNRRTKEEIYLRHQDEIAEPDIDLTSMKTMLKSICSRFGYISIYTEEPSSDEFYLGKIGEMDNHFLLLDAFGTEADPEMSQILFKLSLITRIEVDGKYERDFFDTHK